MEAEPVTDQSSSGQPSSGHPRVAVRGESHLEVDPEVARITLTVTARGTDRRDAIANLTLRNNTALELVRSYGDAVAHVETGSLSVTPELSQRGRGERIRAYGGRVTLSAEITDFTVLGELTTRLADLDHTRVSGPYWSLRTNSPAHRRARQEAVRQAVVRAREYAEALGTTLTGVVDIADIGADAAPVGRGMPRPGGFAGPAAPGAAPEPPALELEPRRQHVRAQVNARFTMAPPTL
ncbi:SIMPL domain-containing protein [Streptomyces sp. UH6]|uniref:SIMPL domain-containing protein n=1 Tax=Streptomyces sp. UH6 TaxID=2748379 RepID=UPI0015D50C95|nr:SIMPL domain-containing protein [Streptomyces sp. UH6]NYV73436.1 SIMPL domain-containing protein [Streptomyces sp. UH6]